MINVYKNFDAGGDWTRPGSSQWCVMVRQGAMAKNWNIGSSTNLQNFFKVREMEHWNRQPRGAVESFSMELCKTHLNAYLCNLL